MTACRRICVADFDVPSCELSSPVLCLDRIRMPEQLLESGLGTRPGLSCRVVHGRMGRPTPSAHWNPGFVQALLSPGFPPESGYHL